MAHSGTVRRSDSAQADGARPRIRFETLDSWRGICALLVAMMHFPASGFLAESPVVRGGYLFVDYFFVLSGAVIMHGYGHRIADGASYLRFMLLRFGRVYPLHVAVLLLFVAFEGLRLAVPALRGDGAAPFTDGNSLSGLVSSLLLLNGVGLEDQLVWNGPSWSISSEFWTYLLFGAVVLLLRERLWLALVAAVAVAPVVLLATATPEYMDTTYAMGFVRCIYGFSLGALIYRLFRREAMPASGDAAPSRLLWTALEVGAMLMVAAFVSLAARNVWSFAAPFVFGAALFVFMHERGLVSQLLRMRLFLWLGTLSYGIYMVHIFVQSRIINAGTLAGKVLGQDFVGPFDMAGESFYGFGVNGALFGTLMMLVMVVTVVIAAWIGNLLVEKPFQALTRRLVDGRDGETGESQRRYAEVAFRPAREAMSAAAPVADMPGR